MHFSFKNIIFYKILNFLMEDNLETQTQDQITPKLIGLFMS